MLLFACNNREKITRDEIVGRYEHLSTVSPWNGIKNIIEISQDSTFTHWIFRDDSLLISEQGKWTYQYFSFGTQIFFDNFTSYIQYQTHDNSNEMFYGEYAIDCKKTLFGRIYLPVNIPYDPDGSPIIPKYKKIKNE